MSTTIGHRIEISRIRIGLSIPQAARRIGVKAKTLENWENDRSEPRADRLTKLSGVLQVPVIWLLTGETPRGSNNDPIKFSETALITQKLERATAMQQDIAALLIEVSADVARLQRELDQSDSLTASEIVPTRAAI